MSPICYHIPASLIQHYQDCPIVVRTSNPTDDLTRLSGGALERLAYLQILSLESAGEELSRWGEGCPLDLRIQHPEQEFSALYRCARLLDTHPVRISIPVRPGVVKAVKVALSLNFAVKLLVVEQPDDALIEELSQVLDVYLHQSMSSQAVEFFHSSLLSLYHQEPVTLWAIQEEDPASSRYVAEDGREYLSERFVGKGLMPVPEELSSYLEHFIQARRAEQGECNGCEFFDVCAGYFKWPETNYSCQGIQGLFSNIREAGRQIREALENFEDAQTETP